MRQSIQVTLNSLSDRIAAAVVAACRVTNEDPLNIMSWGKNTRSRRIVFVAIKRIFPASPHQWVLSFLGSPSVSDSHHFAKNSHALRNQWMSEQMVDYVSIAFETGLIGGDVPEGSETRGGARSGAGRPKLRDGDV
jgi:hypothetical protein